MKKLIAIAVVILIAIGVTVGWPEVTHETEVVEAEAPELTHQQEVWLGALEWCESRGNNNAINEVDLDGTASYYAFQFKPSTFKFYSIHYGLLPADLEDEDYFNWMGVYEKQREVVSKMINDPEVRWEKQFPGCVAKLGRPPKK